MSDTKFTPGPWTVGEVRHAGAFQLVTAGAKGYVCEVRCGYIGNELDHDTRKANARLIAAAPDLYEALEVIAGGDSDVSNTAIIVGNGAKTVLVQVRAALAKARLAEQP